MVAMSTASLAVPGSRGDVAGRGVSTAAGAWTAATAPQGIVSCSDVAGRGLELDRRRSCLRVAATGRLVREGS